VSEWCGEFIDTDHYLIRSLAHRFGLTLGAAYRPDGPYTTSASSAKTVQYAQEFLQQLEQVWPGGTSRYSGLANLSYPTGDPNLLGSYSAYKVGQITGFAGYEGVPQGSAKSHMEWPKGGSKLWTVKSTMPSLLRSIDTEGSTLELVEV